MCAFSRPEGDLLPGIKDIALYGTVTDSLGNSTKAFSLPSLQQVTANKVRVVVVTALMAAKVSRRLKHCWNHQAPCLKPTASWWHGARRLILQHCDMYV